MRSGSSFVKVPASTSCLQSSLCSSSDPSTQCTDSGSHRSTIDCTQSISLRWSVGASVTSDTAASVKLTARNRDRTGHRGRAWHPAMSWLSWIVVGILAGVLAKLSPARTAPAASGPSSSGSSAGCSAACSSPPRAARGSTTSASTRSCRVRGPTILLFGWSLFRKELPGEGQTWAVGRPMSGSEPIRTLVARPVASRLEVDPLALTQHPEERSGERFGREHVLGAIGVGHHDPLARLRVVRADDALHRRHGWPHSRRDARPEPCGTFAAHGFVTLPASGTTCTRAGACAYRRRRRGPSGRWGSTAAACAGASGSDACRTAASCRRPRRRMPSLDLPQGLGAHGGDEDRSSEPSTFPGRARRGRHREGAVAGATTILRRMSALTSLDGAALVRVVANVPRRAPGPPGRAEPPQRVSRPRR